MIRPEATPQIPQRLPPWGRFPGNRYVYTYIHMQTYTYVYIYIHVHIFTCTRMYVCVCVCVRQERTVHLKHDLQKRPIDENRENYWCGVDSLTTCMSKETCTGQKGPPKEAGIKQKKTSKRDVLTKIVTIVIVRSISWRHICQMRHIYDKRDIQKSTSKNTPKETCIHQKRPRKETYSRKRPLSEIWSLVYRLEVPAPPAMRGQPCDMLWQIQQTATHSNPPPPISAPNVTHCHAIQHTGKRCNAPHHAATHCNTLQHTAALCSTLQHSATHCNTLQHTATHCNTLQRTHIWVTCPPAVTDTRANRTAASCRKAPSRWNRSCCINMCQLKWACHAHKRVGRKTPSRWNRSCCIHMRQLKRACQTHGWVVSEGSQPLEPVVPSMCKWDKSSCKKKPYISWNKNCIT